MSDIVNSPRGWCNPLRYICWALPCPFWQNYVRGNRNERKRVETRYWMGIPFKNSAEIAIRILSSNASAGRRFYVFGDKSDRLTFQRDPFWSMDTSGRYKSTLESVRWFDSLTTCATQLSQQKRFSKIRHAVVTLPNANLYGNNWILQNSSLLLY